MLSAGAASQQNEQFVPLVQHTHVIFVYAERLSWYFLTLIHCDQHVFVCGACCIGLRSMIDRAARVSDTGGPPEDGRRRKY